MNEVLRDLNPPTLARIFSHSQTLRASLNGPTLGEAPHSIDVLESVWSQLVTYPVEEEAYDWLVTALGALLAEQLRALYSFRWKELEDEHGISPCMTENRTGVKVFPFDSVARRIQAQETTFFESYLDQIAGVMTQHGLSPKPTATLSTSDTVAAAPAVMRQQKPWWKPW
jgi:hypothetical protein